MSEPLPTVVPAGSPVVARARKLWATNRCLKARVVNDLTAIEDDIVALYEEAESCLRQAQEEAAQVEAQAKQAGEEAAMAQCMNNLARARGEYKKLRDRAEQDMVTLAFHIARRLIGHAIEVQPAVVRDIVGEVLVTARGRQDILVLVHPEDKKVVDAHRHEYARELDGVPVYFEADHSIERGGCVIETESGRIDARLETQLKVLRQALMDGRFASAEPKGEDHE